MMKDLSVSIITALLFLVYLTISLSSCNRGIPLVVPLSVNRLESPEISQGISNLSVGLAFNDLNNITLANNLYDSYPILDTVTFDDTSIPVPSLFISLPLFPRFEFILDTNYGIIFRYQLLGNSRANRTTGALTSAISIGYGFYDSGIIDYDQFYYNSNIDSVSYNWSYNTVNTGLTFGKRIRKNVLIYGGPFYSSHNFSGDLNQYFESDIINNFNMANEITQSGFGLGFEFNFNEMNSEQSILYNVTFTTTSWDANTSQIQVNHGFVVRYYF